MFDVGSIIIMRNLVFKEAGKLDYAYKKGRPCLVIALNDEYYYYLSISSSRRPNSNTNINIEGFYKLSAPSFNNVFKSKICFKEEAGKVPVKTMLNIYKTFIKYYRNHEKCEHYDEVIEYIIDYIKQNEKNIH